MTIVNRLKIGDWRFEVEPSYPSDKSGFADRMQNCFISGRVNPGAFTLAAFGR